MIYFVTFLLAGILFIFTDYFNSKGYKKLSFAFAMLGIVILSILAGMRSSDVGIDVEYYIIPRYNQAKILSLNDYMKRISGERLFYVILYYSSQIGTTTFFPLFIIELLILMPIYFAWYLIKDKCKFSLVMFLYMFLLYNFSLCVMRQFIACSLLLLSFVLLNKNKIIPFIIFSILSVGFHSSSIIFIVFILCCKFIKKSPLKLVFLAMFLIILLNFESILNVLTQYRVIPDYYIERFVVRKEEAGINLGEVIGWSILYVIPLLIYQLNKNSLLSKMTLISYVGLILLWSGLISSSMYRVSLYFRYVLILIYPISIASLKRNNKLVYVDNGLYVLINLVVAVIVMFIWWYIIVSCNFFGTYPYHFINQ